MPKPPVPKKIVQSKNSIIFSELGEAKSTRPNVRVAVTVGSGVNVVNAAGSGSAIGVAVHMI